MDYKNRHSWNAYRLKSGNARPDLSLYVGKIGVIFRNAMKRIHRYSTICGKRRKTFQQFPQGFPQIQQQKHTNENQQSGINVRHIGRIKNPNLTVRAGIKCVRNYSSSSSSERLVVAISNRRSSSSGSSMGLNSSSSSPFSSVTVSMRMTKHPIS